VESKEIILRSDEVNELFAKMPSHLVRWGNTWILVVLFGLLALAYYVKYPDVMTGTVILTSHSAPISLVSQTNGKIKLLKENYTKTQVNEIIAYTIEDAKLSDVDSLYALIKTNEIDSLEYNQMPNWTLGKIQNNWSRFLVELQAYKIYEKSNPEQVGIASSSQQIQKNSLSVANLKEQIKSRESQVDFYKNKLDKDKLLLDRGMISEREYQNAYTQYVEMQNQVKSLRSQLISIDKNNTDYQKQIADYQISKTQNESQKLTNLKQLRINLIEEIEQWYKLNTYRSPIDGQLQFNTPIVDNQFIMQGTELFTITPEVKSEIECNLLVPMTGMGKVAIGQQVIIRLQHYPEEEYGVLNGKVVQISPSALVSKTSQGQEKFYSIKVKLDNGLMTSYKKEIAYQPNMEGSADIITKDRSFLERIFEQLLKLIKR
jgi:multidrug efflux pump subunit AcrA (membrane-fusion protein)